jgi:hypothetical protein
MTCAAPPARCGFVAGNEGNEERRRNGKGAAAQPGPRRQNAPEPQVGRCGGFQWWAGGVQGPGQQLGDCPRAAARARPGNSTLKLRGYGGCGTRA